MAKNKFFSSKRFKYGSVAVAFTVLFVAAVILLNVVLSSLDAKYGFGVDLTDQQVYGISDLSRQLLADQTKPVSIKFMVPLDQLESGSYYPVVVCAENYAREFENVTVEYYDIITNPQNVNYFVERGYAVNQSDVIIQCGDEFKIYSLSSFMPVAQSTGKVFAFRGEMYFTSAILTVTKDEKSEVTFTTNHSESLSPYLEEIFEFCGYKINRVDLTTESISPNTGILVIYDPKNDFQSSADGVSEIEKLSDYLMSNRSAMVFIGPFSPALPHLDEFLDEWGISVARDLVIQDSEKYLPQYNEQNLICDYSPYGDNKDVEALTSSVSSSQTICRSASPITLSAPKKTSTNVFSVLKSSDFSYTTEGEERVRGPFDVMALATRTVMENDGNSGNFERKAHLLVTSTTEFATFCSDNSYANRSLMFNAIKLMNEDQSITGITMKRFDDTSLNIEAGQVRQITAVLVCVIPGIIILAGVVVWIKRKNL